MRAKGEGWFARKLQLGIFIKRRAEKRGVLNKLVGGHVKQLDGGPT